MAPDRHTEGDILREGRIGEVDALRHVRDGSLPRPDPISAQGLGVHQNLAVGRFEETHEQVHGRTLAAAGGAYEADPRPLGDREIQPVQYPWTVARVTKAHPIESNRMPEPQRLGRRLQQFLRYRLIQELDDVRQYASASRDAGPRGVGLLQRREHALGAYGQRAEYRQRRGNTPVLTAQAVCKRRYQHHAKRLHRVARTLRDENVVALRPSQGLVRLTIGFAIHRLRAIQQHVAYATQTFLQRLYDLSVLVSDAFGCCDAACVARTS